jgi:pilus assembly protein CpaE
MRTKSKPPVEEFIDEDVVLRNPVAVIDSSARFRSVLSARLRRAPSAGSHASVEAFDEAIDPGEGVVIVFGPSVARKDGLDAIGRLLRARPEVKAVMMVETLSTDILQSAIRAGVTDVVLYGSPEEELLDAVIRADQQLRSREAGGDPSRRAGKNGRVTTVFSTKGGSGKSVVATNLAVALAKRGPSPVVLVDADLQFGDVAVMLHMTPHHTVADAIESIDRLDAQVLKTFLARHEGSGVFILAAPVEPAFADQVSVEDMLQIIDLLRSFAAHVVIDTPAVLNDLVVGLLEAADDIVVVGGMDIPTIKDVKVGLQTLRLLDVPTNRLRLLLNRANTKVKVEIQEVERTLQLRAESLVPSDILVPTSVNRGVPAVLEVPRSGVARAITTMADALLASDVTSKRS